MQKSTTENDFEYRRMTGSHRPTYHVEIRGSAYRISVGGRLVCKSAVVMLSEDADINASIRAFAISDIENLVRMNDR